MAGSNVDVGTSAQGINRDGASLQVLGTPLTKVIFTSDNDASIGSLNDPVDTSPQPGDWGGLVFRNQQDYLAGNPVAENQGIFLNYVNNADSCTAAAR